MNRKHERLFHLTERIDRLRAEERLTDGELGMLEHLDDDARRDAAGGGPLERDDARMTSGDVARFRKTLGSLRRKRARLAEKRERLLKRLG